MTHRLWRAKDDHNWRIQSGTSAGNGDPDGEFWQLWTPDGTLYEFGRHTIPEGGDPTNAVWTMPVWGDDPGDPCSEWLGYCQQAWRWNLDRVVDPNGNRMTYRYGKDQNSFRQRFYNIDETYTRGGRLTEIEYGQRPGQAVGTAKVVFDHTFKCNTLSAACGWPTPSNGTLFPDIPNDLLCSSGCTKYTPSFFEVTRLQTIRTQTRVGGVWRDVDAIHLTQEWASTFEDADADGQTDLDYFLRYLRLEGLSEPWEGGPWLLPTIRFDGCHTVGSSTTCALLDNRRDPVPASGVLPLKHWRVNKIVTDTGAEIRVDYGQPTGCASIPHDHFDTMPWPPIRSASSSASTSGSTRSAAASNKGHSAHRGHEHHSLFRSRRLHTKADERLAARSCWPARRR